MQGEPRKCFLNFLGIVWYTFISKNKKEKYKERNVFPYNPHGFNSGDTIFFN